MRQIPLHIFLALIFLFNSGSFLKAEVSHSYTLTNEEMLDEFFNKENFGNQYYYKSEQKKKDEFDRLNQLLSKKSKSPATQNILEIENYINEHKKLKSEAIRKLYDERLGLVVNEINRLIKRNEELIKTGRAEETVYYLDMRAKVNKLPFIKDDAKAPLIKMLAEKNIALQKKFDDDKVRFFVLLNIFYPENKLVRYEKDGKYHYVPISAEDTDKYLKEYTEEVCRASELTSKGILLNVESVLSHDKEKNKYYFKYPVYIGTGKDLKNSEKRTLHELIQDKILSASNDYRFEIQGQDPDTDAAFAHRAKILENYIFQLPALLLDSPEKNLIKAEDYKYLVTLSHLSPEEKQSIKVILNTKSSSVPSATFADFRGTGLKDYAGMSEYLQKFLVSDLSKWKSENSSANLKIITTSDNRLYRGTEARDLLLKETPEPNDLIVAMHFKEENGEIKVHWDAQWGSKLNFIAGKDFNELWEEIKTLDKNEQFQKYFEDSIEGVDWGFSQVTAVLGAIADVMKDKRIPEPWYNWSITAAFFSGMINGLLDDVTGTVEVINLAAQFTIATTEMPYRLALFAYKYTFNENIRNKVNSTISLICSTGEHTLRSLKDFAGKLVDIGLEGGKKCLSGLADYGSTLIQGDYKAFYQYGYGLEQIASLLLGYAELKQIANGAKVSKVLINSATGLFDAIKQLIKGIGQIVTTSIDAGITLVRDVVIKLADYGKLLADNFGSFIDDLYFASIKAYRAIFFKNPNDFGGLVLAYASEYSYRNLDQVDNLPYGSFKDYLKKMSTYLDNNLDKFGSKIDPSDLSNAGKVEIATAKALYEKNLQNIQRIGDKVKFDKLSSKVPDPNKLGQILDKLDGITMDKITGIMNNVPVGKVDDLITSGLLDQIKARSNLADDLAGSNELAKNLAKLIEEPQLVNAWDVYNNSGRKVLRTDITNLKTISNILNNKSLSAIGVTKDALSDISKATSALYPNTPNVAIRMDEELFKNLENLGSFLEKNPATKFENFEKIISDLTNPSGFGTQKGANWIIKDIAESSNEFAGKHLKFNSTQLVNGTNYYIDAEKIIPNAKSIFIEYKSGPGSITKENFVREFVKRDLTNNNVSDITQIHWRIEEAPSNLLSNMRTWLKSVEAKSDLNNPKVLKLFDDFADNSGYDKSIRSLDDLLLFIEKEDVWFDKIFKVK